MDSITQFFRKLPILARRGQFNRDLEEEMAFHRDLAEQELRANGMTPQSARNAASRQFGNATILREVSGDVWSWRWLEHIAQDLRHGTRALLHAPGFAAVAVLALALGIGANTAIFSVVNAVLLRPLAYEEPERLVTILHFGDSPVAVANYVDWRDQSRSFQSMAAAEYWSPNLTGSDPPEHLLGLRMTQNMLPMLGIQPLLGRMFGVGEDQKGAEHEVILSYRLWQRRFGAARNVLGRAIMLDGEGYTVVGVMPREFQFAPFWATRAELWAPLAFGDRIRERDGNSLRVFARLKPGVALAQARAEIATITAQLEQKYPATNRDILVTPLKENVVGKVETPLLMLLGAGGFVLLIACANVAHMLLARTSDRKKEIAVRTALGAGRTRVIGQFLTENLLLAGAGASAGLLLAYGGTKALAALSPANIPRVEMVVIDDRVMLFLVGIAALTALLFGLAPAMQATVGNLSGSLKEGGREGSDGTRHNRLRSFLVASEFALAFMLLIGAGLMMRSFIVLQLVDPGFNPHNVLSMVVSVAGSNESGLERRAIFYRQLLDQVRALPGVKAAGGINHLPLAGDLWGRSFNIEGRPEPRPGDSPGAVYRIVMPGYFETMRLPLRLGRAITERDDARAPGVVIINERAARKYWPAENPIGKRISIDTGKSDSHVWLTIIGVAANAKQSEWAAVPDAEIYLAALQSRDFLEDGGAHMAYLTLVVRTTGSPGEFAPAVKRVVWSFDRFLPISEVITMDRVVADANARPRFEMYLLGLFAAVALLLAAVGIYGVMTYTVSRRTREIGIRISLGASRADVLRMVVRQGMLEALAGMAAGVMGALLLSKLMAGMLYGVQPTDLVTFGGVAIVLGLAALLATYVPARRATRIEPMVALRQE
jgi:predicted permease